MVRCGPFSYMRAAVRCMYCRSANGLVFLGEDSFRCRDEGKCKDRQEFLRGLD